MEENLRRLSTYTQVKSDGMIKNKQLSTQVKLEGNYFYAINTVICPFQYDLFIITPVYPLSNELSEQTLQKLKNYQSSLDYCQKTTFNRKMSFYLSQSNNIENIQEEFFEELEVIKLFKIEEISDIFTMFINSGDMSFDVQSEKDKIENYDNHRTINYSTFDVFMLSKIKNIHQINNILIINSLKTTNLKIINDGLALGDQCKIITNSQILNSYNQFKSRVFNGHISLIKEFNSTKVIWLGLNGIPELEGSLVCDDKLTGGIGIVLPVIYHQGSFREAINLCASLKVFYNHIAINCYGSLKSSLQKHSNSQASYNRIILLGKHLKLTENQPTTIDFFKKNRLTNNRLINRWIERVGFLESYSNDGVYQTGSCLYLKNGFFLTNSHLFVDNHKSIAFVILCGNRYKIENKVKSKGSQDLAIFKIGCRVMHLDEYYEEIIEHSQLEIGLKNYSEILNIGYPIFDSKLYDNCVYCSKGILSKKVGGSNSDYQLLSTGLIYSGNSGGILLGGDGRLGGLIFSCSKDVVGPINSINLAINALHFRDILSYVGDDKKWNEKEILDHIESLTFSSTEIDSQSSYVSLINLP